jgi:hypothetical protein
MKIKTMELTGAALDWAVAKCEGHESRCPWLLEKEGYTAWQSYERAWGNPLPRYSTNWAQGGPIIEREKMCIDEPNCDADCRGWSAVIIDWASKDDEENSIEGFGPTPLIAAMRCYVASKLGDEVEIPKELT